MSGPAHIHLEMISKADSITALAAAWLYIEKHMNTRKPGRGKTIDDFIIYHSVTRTVYVRNKYLK